MFKFSVLSTVGVATVGAFLFVTIYMVMHNTDADLTKELTGALITSAGGILGAVAVAFKANGGGGEG